VNVPALCDGCSGAQPLWGCPKEVPRLAVGSQARFVIGSVSGTADDEHRLGRAEANSLNRSVVSANRDEAGLLVLDAIAPGATTVELVDNGEVIDTVKIVSRDEITEIELFDLISDSTTNKGRLEAVAKIAGTELRGGPACDWHSNRDGRPTSCPADSNATPAVTQPRP